jgi:hypothetical protein
MLFKIKATVQIKKKKKGVLKHFNPLLYDAGNLLALYDGDTLVSDPAGVWSDRSGNAFDLTQFNNPTIRNANINGHDALEFDGISQYAQNSNPAFIRNQPHTTYIVFKPIVWTAGSATIDSSDIGFNAVFQDIIASPQKRIFAGIGLVGDNYTIGNYDISTLIFNGLNSETRKNNNIAIVGDAGANNAVGINLGCTGALANFANVAIAYLIVRNGADNTATQNLFINWLKNRFAL